MMKKLCDLHVHTTHSDGTLSSADVVCEAKRAGLVCIAVTDHDTVGGIAEAQQEGKRLGVEVIAGVEISTEFSPGVMHILGYLIEWQNPEFEKGLAEIQSDRRRRNQKIVERLKQVGIHISLRELEQTSEDNQISRLHFARLLMKKGFVGSRKEAFDKYLGSGKPAYVKREHVLSSHAIKLIRSAGGVAVLAHPACLGFPVESEEFCATIERLKTEGLEGLEVYSSAHKADQARKLMAITDRFGLVPTGGSDFHGDNKTIDFGYVGKGASVPYEWIERMKRMILGEKRSLKG